MRTPTEVVFRDIVRRPEPIQTAKTALNVAIRQPRVNDRNDNYRRCGEWLTLAVA